MKYFLSTLILCSTLFAFEHGYDPREIKEYKVDNATLKVLIQKQKYPGIDIFIANKKIASYDQEGGMPKVKEIVISKDKTSLAILVGWKNLHRSLGIDGVYYELDIFKKQGGKYIKEKKLSKSGFDGLSDHEDVYFKYQSKESIKDYLEKGIL